MSDQHNPYGPQAGGNPQSPHGGNYGQPRGQFQQQGGDGQYQPQGGNGQFQQQGGNYQQPQEQPKKKKKWPWIVGILAVLIIIAAIAGGGSEEGSDNESSNAAGSSSAPAGTDDQQNAASGDSNSDAQSEAAPEQEAAPAEESGDGNLDVAIGESVETNNLNITVNNLRFENDVLGSYVCTDVDLKNNSDKSVSFNQFDFKLHKPNGVVSDTTFTGLDIQNLETAELSPSGQTSGSVCFDSDGTPGEYKVEYTGGFFAKEASWKGNL